MRGLPGRDSACPSRLRTLCFAPTVMDASGSNRPGRIILDRESSMLKLFGLTALVIALGVVLAPSVIPLLSWVLAFLSLLMLGDLLRSALRKHRGRDS